MVWVFHHVFENNQMLEPDEQTDLVGVVSLTPLNNFMLVKLGSPPSSATWAAGTPGGRTAQSGDGTNEGWSEGSFGVAVFWGERWKRKGKIYQFPLGSDTIR